MKLTNTRLNQLKSSAKYNPRSILKITRKNVKMKNKLIAKKATKIRNAFANNISADIKLTKAQIFKRFKPGGSFFPC